MTGIKAAYLAARRFAYAQVCPEARAAGISPLNWVLVLSVLLAVVIQVLETEPVLYEAYEGWFIAGDVLVGTVFCIDLLIRIWAIGELQAYAGFRGRIRYLRRLRTLIDVLAVLPFLVAPWLGFLDANDLAFLRLLIATNILLSARLGRLSTALSSLRYAVVSRREDLLVGLVFAMSMMLATAVGLYLVEGGIQPASFGSIPRALWWSLETLTTVGYGDVYPQSVLGKVLAGIFALAGIGIIAIPTGILAAAFNEAFMKEDASVSEPNGKTKPGNSALSQEQE